MGDFIIIALICLQSKPTPYPQCNHKVYSILLGTMKERDTDRDKEMLSALEKLIIY